ncbi:MAG: MarR family transcriptional regulator [Parahaliea sp.]
MNPPKTGELPLMVHLLKAYYWYDVSLQTSMRQRSEIQLNRAQSMVLCSIAFGLNNPARMAETLGMSRQLLNHHINQLEENELLRRIPDPHDKRSVMLEASESDEIHKHVYEVLSGLDSVLKKILGTKDFGVLKRSLEKDWGPKMIIDIENRQVPI